MQAWQPILSPATVLPTFFIIGLIFVPLGGVLLWGSNKVRPISTGAKLRLSPSLHPSRQVKEFTIDYTRCEFEAPNDTFAQLPSSKYEYRVGSSVSAQAPSWQFTHDEGAPVGQQSLCRLQFELPVEMEKPVFMYYKRASLHPPLRSLAPTDESPRAQSQTTTRTTGGMSSRSTRTSSWATRSRTTRSAAATASPSTSRTARWFTRAA